MCGVRNIQNIFFAFQFPSITFILNGHCYVYFYIVAGMTDDACCLRFALTAIGSQHSAYLAKRMSWRSPV
jgi:hypothetical protein